MAFFIIQLCSNILDLYLQVNTNLQFQHPHQGKILTATEVTEKPPVSNQRQDHVPLPFPRRAETGTISDPLGSSNAAAAAEHDQFPA